MRHIILAAVAVMGLCTAAYAGEGNGDPFPGAFAGVTSRVDPRTMVMRDQDPYQYRVVAAPNSMAGQVRAPSANQDPFPFRVASRVITFQPAATAVASTASPASVAQGAAAPHG